MRKAADQKIVIVRRATRLQGLKKRYATVAQAEFVLDRMVDQDTLRRTGKVRAKHSAPSALADYRQEDETYQQAIEQIQIDLDGILPVQLLDRELLPTYLFGPQDIVITVGQDGLVANTAKYAVGLPIIGVNPDPGRFDGVLLPFRTDGVRNAVNNVLRGSARMRPVTLAEVLLSDGQTLLAFNDLFVGCRTHVSARYRVEIGKQSEAQSSSGVLISTGAGSTGWLSSLFNMAAGLAAAASGSIPKRPAMQWEDPRLAFVVREPFISRTSGASVVCGLIEPGRELIIESQMPAGGVIFSDGIETDYLEFTSGSIARIRAAQKRATLVV